VRVKFRTATYNICKGATGIAGRSRVHDVRLALHLIDADLVFLQEVQDRTDRRRIRIANRQSPESVTAH